MGVHLTDGDDNGRKFVEKHGWSFPILSDNDWVAAGKWGVQGHPALVLLDPYGRVVAGRYGAGDEAAWDELAAQL